MIDSPDTTSEVNTQALVATAANEPKRLWTAERVLVATERAYRALSRDQRRGGPAERLLAGAATKIVHGALVEPERAASLIAAFLVRVYRLDDRTAAKRADRLVERVAAASKRRAAGKASWLKSPAGFLLRPPKREAPLAPETLAGLRRRNVEHARAVLALVAEAAPDLKVAAAGRARLLVDVADRLVAAGGKPQVTLSAVESAKVRGVIDSRTSAIQRLLALGALVEVTGRKKARIGLRFRSTRVVRLGSISAVRKALRESRKPPKEETPSLAPYGALAVSAFREPWREHPIWHWAGVSGALGRQAEAVFADLLAAGPDFRISTRRGDPGRRPFSKRWRASDWRRQIDRLEAAGLLVRAGARHWYVSTHDSVAIKRLCDAAVAGTDAEARPEKIEREHAARREKYGAGIARARRALLDVGAFRRMRGKSRATTLRVLTGLAALNYRVDRAGRSTVVVERFSQRQARDALVGMELDGIARCETGANGEERWSIAA